LLWGLSALDAMFVAVALIASGPVTAFLLQRYRALMVLFGVTLAITAAALVAPIGTQTRQAILAAEHQYLTMPAAAGVTASNAAATKSMVLWMITQTSMLWPTIAFFTMGIGVAIGVPLVARAGRSLGLPVKGYGPLADVDLSFHLIWPAILGLGLTALGAIWHQAPTLVGTIGANVLMIVRPVLFLQGAAVFAALYRRMGAGRVLRVFGIALLVITELLVPAVSVLGGVDLFANLRKVPRAEAHAPHVSGA
jgi:uncharacterized protein YybS (DUF2232 family)